MEERFLYSNVWPLLTKDSDKTVDDCFAEEIKKSDQLEIAVGFSSCESLKELDKWVVKHNIKKISLILGMYFFTGFPLSLLKLALEINKKWQKAGIGEIRVIYSFRYHGKLYYFSRNNKVNSAIIGSPNLSFLVANEITRLKLQQYEIAIFTNNLKTLKNAQDHINSLKSENISKNIAILEKWQLFVKSKSHLELQNRISKI